MASKSLADLAYERSMYGDNQMTADEVINVIEYVDATGMTTKVVEENVTTGRKVTTNYSRVVQP